MQFDVKFNISNQSFIPSFDKINNISDGGYDRGYAEGYDEGYKEGKNDGLESFDAMVEGQPFAAFGNALSIAERAFYGNKYITEANFPLVETVGRNAFYSCDILASVTLPAASYINNSAFEGCAALESVNLPRVTTFGGRAFLGCSKLSKVNFPSVTTIWETAFSGCATLETVILLSNTLCRLTNVSVFTGTPIANGTGFIYVPDNLVEQYKVAANWSTYASQIKPLSELEQN